MIDPKLLRSDPEAVARNMARRGLTLDVEAWRALEEKRKPFQIEVDRLRSERNANAKAVGMAKGKGTDASELIARGEGSGAAGDAPLERGYSAVLATARSVPATSSAAGTQRGPGTWA